MPNYLITKMNEFRTSEKDSNYIEARLREIIDAVSNFNGFGFTSRVDENDGTFEACLKEGNTEYHWDFYDVADMNLILTTVVDGEVESDSAVKASSIEDALESVEKFVYNKIGLSEKNNIKKWKN